MKKYTKKQKEAVDNLACMIDELNNKPRRLFNSLIKFADVFLIDKEQKAETMDTIRDFERRYYMFYTLSDIASDLLQNSNNVIRELTGEVAFNKISYPEKTEERRRLFSEYSQGVEDACRLLSEKMIKEIIKNIN